MTIKEINQMDCQYQLYIDMVAKGKSLSKEMQAQFHKCRKALGYDGADVLVHIEYARIDMLYNGEL